MMEIGKRAQGILWVSLAVMVLVIPGWVFFSGAAGQPGRKRNGGGESVRVPPLSMRGLHMEEFSGSGKELDLWAGKAELSREDEQLHLSDIKIRWRSKDKTGQWYDLVGDRATYRLDEKKGTARGNIRIVSADGYTLATETVRYDYGNRRIEGPGKVEMNGPEGWTEGVGFQLDLGDERVVLQKSVHSLMRPSALERAREVLKK